MAVHLNTQLNDLLATNNGYYTMGKTKPKSGMKRSVAVLESDSDYDSDYMMGGKKHNVSKLLKNSG